MLSLYDCLENEYKQLSKTTNLELNDYSLVNKCSFQELINDDKLCIKLISQVLELDITNIAINRYRASHIVSTWLLGLGLGRYFNFERGIQGLCNLYYQKIWLQSAILHDYGYFCNEINKDNLQIEEITKNYNLLTDNYSDYALTCLNGMSLRTEFARYFSYTYDEIEKYFRYSKAFHKNDEEIVDYERSDHGIVGGCIAFSKYCKNIKHMKINFNYGSSDVLTIIQKLSCIIAVSHNIFKSKDEEKDNEYKTYGLYNLLSNSPIRIKKENNFLSLLSLVDTIECTKRFSKKVNPDEYLIQSTTLKYVDIDLQNGEITINFQRLNEYLTKTRKSNEMVKKLKAHVDSVANLNTWTEFNSHIGSNNKEVRISIKND